MFSDVYSWATKILDAEYNTASLDDIIKACENLHVEEQHQLKILLQKYQDLFDGILREFKMGKMSVIIQLMDTNSKPIYAVNSLFLDQWNRGCNRARKS
jgi:hypothetical protein